MSSFGWVVGKWRLMLRRVVIFECMFGRLGRFFEGIIFVDGGTDVVQE